MPSPNAVQPYYPPFLQTMHHFTPYRSTGGVFIGWCGCQDREELPELLIDQHYERLACGNCAFFGNHIAFIERYNPELARHWETLDADGQTLR